MRQHQSAYIYNSSKNLLVKLLETGKSNNFKRAAREVKKKPKKKEKPAWNNIIDDDLDNTQNDVQPDFYGGQRKQSNENWGEDPQRQKSKKAWNNEIEDSEANTIWPSRQNADKRKQKKPWNNGMDE